MDNDDALIGRILSRREALVLLSAAGAAMLAACAKPAQPAATLPSSTPSPLSPADSATNAATSVATEGATAAGSTPAATPLGAKAATAPAISGSPTAQATVLAGPTSVAVANVPVQPSCVVSPQMTAGPYFVDEKLNRSDIRANTSDGTLKEGVPLKLTIRVAQVSGTGCTALAGAQVDIWHCDAVGVYSDASDPSFNTRGQNFLRGYQVTDANGAVTFNTIFPGWYQGRAVHVHFKVRNGATQAQNFDFTSQFFFTEADSLAVYAQTPYASRGTNFLRNAQDGIFNGGGDQTTLALTKDGTGYATTFDLGIQLA